MLASRLNVSYYTGTRAAITGKRGNGFGALYAIQLRSAITMGTEFPPKKRLIDGFGREHTYLRVSLVEKCNLRCNYCMPEDLKLTPKEQLLSTSEMLKLVNIFSNLGISKVRLTGGEPLLKKDIVEICTVLGSNKQIKSIGITTNGILLTRYASKLYDAGVRNLNISLDTLDSQKFVKITQRGGHDLVMKGIRLAESLGFKIKLNCVVQRNLNEEELVPFVLWTKYSPLEIRFLEFMPFEGNAWKDEASSVFPYQEMLDRIRKQFPDLHPLPSQDANSTAKLYQVPGFVGSFGFISAMSDEFCSSCNRLRLTADGNIKNCLFGNDEVSIRDVLRDESIKNEAQREEAIVKLIQKSVENKKEKLGGVESPNFIQTKRPMILIGG